MKRRVRREYWSKVWIKSKAGYEEDGEELRE